MLGLATTFESAFGTACAVGTLGVGATMTAVAVAATAVMTEPCGHCDFAFQEAAELTAGLRCSTVRYRQVGYVLTDPIRLLQQQHRDGPWTGVDCLVHVREALHDYTNQLIRFTRTRLPLFGHLDPAAAQPYAQDYSTAIVGLTANLERLAQVIEAFPARLWCRPGILRGRRVRAIDIANYAVHEAAHHLVDLELLFERAEEDHLDVVTA